MQATCLNVGDRETHRVGHAVIAIQRTTATTYMTTVEAGSTGARVDQLTSGPWATERQARDAMANAIAAFETGRTVEHVLMDLAEDARHQLFAAQRRRDIARVNELNALLDRFDFPAQAAVDRVVLAEMADTIRTGPARRTWAVLKAGHAAGLARDLAEVTR